MTAIPILPAGIDKEDYWFIEVRGVEWLYMMKKLTSARADAPISEQPVMVMDGEIAAPIWMLKKKFYPIEVLEQATGMNRTTIMNAELIRLSVKKKDLPKPTVSYWGEA